MLSKWLFLLLERCCFRLAVLLLFHFALLHWRWCHIQWVHFGILSHLWKWVCFEWQSFNLNSFQFSILMRLFLFTMEWGPILAVFILIMSSSSKSIFSCVVWHKYLILYFVFSSVLLLQELELFLEQLILVCFLAVVCWVISLKVLFVWLFCILLFNIMWCTLYIWVMMSGFLAVVVLIID